MLLAAGMLLFAAGCDSSKDSATAVTAAAQQADDTSARRGTPLPAQTYFPLQLGDKEIRVQLALTDAERGRGLMGRKALDTDHGMLFVFEQPSRQSFWMANTPLPLDIGYFDAAGILREVYPLYPFDRTSVVSRRSDIRYALEMTQGWFAQNGIRPGAALDLEALAQAQRSRGF